MGGGSRSGGRSSGGSGRRHYRTAYSRKRRPGLRKYSYTDAKGREIIFYANIQPLKKNPLKDMIFPLIVIIVIMANLMIMIPDYFRQTAYLIQTPKKLEETDQHFTGEYILDNAGIFDSMEITVLTSAFAQLREETGIVPYLYTIYLDDIADAQEDSYSLLERHGMSIYEVFFQDESHMLLLYGVWRDDESDWLWCQIQGDDVDPLITSGAFTAFQKDMQDNLSQPGLSTGGAIAQSIRDMTPKLTVRTMDDILSGMAGIGAILAFIMAILGIGVNNVRKQMKINAYLDSRKSWEKYVT